MSTRGYVKISVEDGRLYQFLVETVRLSRK